MSNAEHNTPGTPDESLDAFTQRVMRYLDGLSSPEEFETLKAELHGCVDRRRLFVELCRQARTIAEGLRPIELADAGYAVDVINDDRAHGAEPDVLSEVIEEALDARRRHEIEDRANQQLAEDLRDQRQRSRHVRRLAAMQRSPRVILVPKPVAVLGAGAIAALLMLAIYLLASSGSGDASAVPIVRDSAPQTRPGTPRYVATLTGLTSDTVWADRSEGWVVGMSLEVGEIHLTQGTAMVELNDGAEVTLHAPVRFSVLGTNASELHYGRVQASVPASGQGFEVFVPGGVVTDWGSSVATITADTESEVGSTVEVMRGSVQVTPRQAGRRGEPVLLRRNQFASLAADGSAVRGYEHTTHQVEIDAPNTGKFRRHGEADPGWRIRVDSNRESHPAIVVAPDPDAPGFDHLQWWFGSSSCSHWIALHADGSGGDIIDGYGANTLHFSTTIAVPGHCDPDSVVLDLKMIVDNQLMAIRINGKQVAGPFDRPDPNRGNDDAVQYQRWIHHTLADCFVPGENTIEFVIHNENGPTGIRVAMECTGTQVFAELD